VEHADGQFEIITWTTISPREEFDPETKREAETVYAA